MSVSKLKKRLGGVSNENQGRNKFPTRRLLTFDTKPTIFSNLTDIAKELISMMPNFDKMT